MTPQDWEYVSGRFNHEFIGYIGLLLLVIATLPPCSRAVTESPFFRRHRYLAFLLVAYWVGTIIYLLYRLSGLIPYDVDFSHMQYVFYPYVIVAILMLRLEMEYYTAREAQP